MRLRRAAIPGRFLQGHQWRDPEIREKRAAKLRGRPLTPEHRAKLTAVRTGKPHSEQRRKAIAQGRIAARSEPYYSAEDRGYATACWVWTRAPLKSGYGAVRRSGKTLRGHHLT